MKKAFTLAEVLITLGIIGVVAALTLPILISKNKERVVETRLQKFYSIMNQAFEMSEVENGEAKYWEYPSATLSNLEWYNKYLKKYIKSVNVTETGINTQGSIRPIAIYFADGSAVIYGVTWLFYPEAKKLKNKTYGDDDSTIYANVDDSGRDWFTFSQYSQPPVNENYSKRFGPYIIGWDGTIESLKNHPSLGCRKSVSGTTERAYCAALIQYNGWKIPEDYPIKF